MTTTEHASYHGSDLTTSNNFSHKEVEKAFGAVLQIDHDGSTIELALDRDTNLVYVEMRVDETVERFLRDSSYETTLPDPT